METPGNKPPLPSETSQEIIHATEDVLGVMKAIQDSLGVDRVGLISRDPTTVSDYKHGNAEFYRPPVTAETEEEPGQPDVTNSDES